MAELREAIQTLGIWIDMWSDELSDRDELDDCDAEERKVIAAARLVMQNTSVSSVKARAVGLGNAWDQWATGEKL